MRKLFIIIILIGFVGLLFNGNVMAQDLKGYYNLNEYEEISGNKINKFQEAPMLKEQVQAGKLPSVQERIPDNPLVQIPWENIGKYGGTLRWDEFTADYDIYLRHINKSELLERPPSSKYYFYSGLAGPTQPGIFSKWKMGEDGKTFTFKIREGLNWSDGVPVTTEDVDYYINDVLKNKEITPVLPKWLNWGGEQVNLKIVDKYTFKLIFSKPYGAFIEDRDTMREREWAGLMRPKHYVKKFHKDYTDWDEILPIMEDRGYTEKDEWGTFYSEVDTAAAGGNLIKVPYPEEYPTLNPYIVTEVKDSGDWILARNPYFYMVDTVGNQLPYIDKLNRQYVSNKEMINMDVIQGKTDLQCQFTRLADYPLFKKNEEKGNYKVLPLKIWQSQMLMYYLNPSVSNEVFPRQVMEDARFRRALSLAIDREQIKESVFLGFGRIAQVAPNPGTPYYEEGMAEAYAEYNPERAKSLLNEMDLVDSNGNGWREGPDGEDIVLPFIYYNVTPPATSGAEIAKRYWEEIGIKVDIKQVNGNYFWQKSNANQIPVSVFWLAGTNIINPVWFNFMLGAPGWYQWDNSNGEKGVEPLPWAKEVFNAHERLKTVVDKQERIKIGKKIWQIQADKIFLIGTVADTVTPFIYNENLGNIEIAREKGYPSTAVMEAMAQWYYKE